MTNMQILVGLCNQLAKKKQELAELEARTKEKAAEIKRLSSVTIPDALKEVGVREIKLDTGVEISYKTVTYANISEERADAAFKWMEEHGFEPLIKTEMDVNKKKAVHSQTLKKFVRERIEFESEISNKVPEQDKLPRDLFGVFQEEETVVKETAKP
jgi:hypothetical protein